ncbi:MAG: hypothetical protein KDF60_08170 [Calditrichaeota bacterium]|nr:hypothetical protein [Calditrichota bacterium]
MRIPFLAIILSGLLIHTLSAKEKIIHKIFSTANLIDIGDDDPFLIELDSLLALENSPYSVVINGDIIKGKIGHRDSLKILSLLNIADNIKQGKMIFLSGDRDWDNSGKDGKKHVKQLEKFIESFNNPKVKWAIGKACPGPKTIELNNNLLFIAINTQWWNHPFDKPGPQDADCKISDTDNFLEELEDVLDENSDKNVLIAGHFPIVSLGEYGGHFPLKKQLFPIEDFYLPLPVLGTMYTSYRRNIGTSYDIINENFQEIQEHFFNIINHHQSLIYLSGHEKNQQILKLDKNYYINSGAPVKADYISNNKNALLAESKAGIIELIYYNNGKVQSKFHSYRKKRFHESTQFTLFQSACEDSSGNAPVNKTYVPCRRTIEPLPETIPESPGQKTIIAGKEYEAGAAKRFFWGDHYRTTWTAPVLANVLDLDTTYGGLTVYKRGGGRQTKSLKFKAGNGFRYTFRSVDKDPVKALPWKLRETIAAKILKDQTSTQNPYGALAADKLLNPLGILHAHPKLYVMPDDERLGPFRQEFANMPGLLEENPSNPKSDEIAFAGAGKIYRSHEMFRQLYKDHDNRVDTREFVLARMFDILVGDWGKHEDNWKWAAFESDSGYLFRPIPRDRDHVFSLWDGLFPWLADREWAKESGENFDYEIAGLRSLMFQARHLDRFIGSNLTKDDWINAARFIQQKITSNIIDQAVAAMPPETFQLSGKTIAEKLKSRLRHLPEYAEKYYEMIAKQVDVVGSSRNEFFDVLRHKDGSVSVKMYAADKNGFKKNESVLYNRTFNPSETEEIRLFGLDGVDGFDVHGTADESIIVRLIGGPEADRYDDTSSVNSSGKHTLIYENSSKAYIKTGSEARQVFNADPTAYDYDRTAFTYDSYFPLPYVGYNGDDGFSFNLDYEMKIQAYGKEDFARKHNFHVGMATSGAVGLGYTLQLHHLIGSWDLVANAHLDNPGDVFNYFGTGNNSIKNEALYNKDFYQTRRNQRELSVGLLKQFWKKSLFNIDAAYEFSEISEPDSLLLASVERNVGINQAEILKTDFRLDLDFRDDSNLPKYGMRMLLSHENGFITTNAFENYQKFYGFLEYFNTIDFITHVTLGLKGGGGISSGTTPYFKRLSLGQEEFLRGFSKNRFIGDKMVFVNSDLRFYLLTWHTSVVPVEIGIKGFFDSGKILETTLDFNNWHNSYGFGVYFVPLEKDFTINTSFAFSNEETMLFTIGIGTAFK